jgi:hypothetical protein
MAVSSLSLLNKLETLPSLRAEQKGIWKSWKKKRMFRLEKLSNVKKSQYSDNPKYVPARRLAVLGGGASLPPTVDTGYYFRRN